MAGETTLTLVGNLVDTPELRITSSGVAVAKFRIASTPRTFDKASGQFKDGDALFLSCTVWRDLAEHVVESLDKGSRVILTGTLAQRSYETKEGEKRTVHEVTVDEIGPSLRYATAKPVKATRDNNNGGGRRGDDEWAAATPAGPQRGSFDEEPPF